jgi:hypothetical protein
MPDQLLANYKSESQTAKALGHTERTLRKWRQLGTGPAYTKIGRKTFYAIGALEAWLKARETKPVRAA